MIKSIFDRFSEKKVLGAFGLYEDNEQLQRYQFDQFLIEFEGDDHLLFVCNIDTDEVIPVIDDVNAKINDQLMRIPVPLSKKKSVNFLGWIWECRNSQGYVDLIVFSWDDISPSFGIYSIGSELCVCRLEFDRWLKG